ncbi:hypothetical protein K9N50_11160 [bacterium]|nr:hypothetical protein [bacterium]
MKRLTVLFIFTILLSVLIVNYLPVSASSMPQVTNYYHPGSWASPLSTADLSYDIIPDSSFYAYQLNIDGSEPFMGYPYHSGLVKGVNDTLRIKFILCNRTGSPIPIANQSPGLETWVMPVVYNSYFDYENDITPIDSNYIDYEIAYWQNPGVGLTIPDTLMPGKDCSMMFYVWNLPTGPNVAAIVKTDLAPVNTIFAIDKNGFSDYLYTIPKVAKDTINAYSAICRRIRDGLNFTSALSWTDSILALNDSSIVGWYWRAEVYGNMQDTLSTINCYQNVVSLINNNNDPLIHIQDTTGTKVEWYWAYDRRTWAEFWTWKFITGSIFFGR